MLLEFGLFKVQYRFGACEIKEVVCLFVILEDCRIGLGARLIQRSNIVENPSRCEGTRCTLVDKGN